MKSIFPVSYNGYRVLTRCQIQCKLLIGFLKMMPKHFITFLHHANMNFVPSAFSLIITLITRKDLNVQILFTSLNNNNLSSRGGCHGLKHWLRLISCCTVMSHMSQIKVFLLNRNINIKMLIKHKVIYYLKP